MKSTAVTENLTQLTRFGMVNAFLVKEEDGFTLIDTMIGGSEEQLIDAAAALGSPIVRILVTHAHEDHIGSMEALAKALPDAEVISPKRDAEIIRGDKSPEPGEPEGKLRGRFSEVDVDIDRELVEGDRVGSLEVFAVPGHTPGQIALHDTRDKSLIAADTFSTLGGVATTAGPYWRFPLPGYATWNRPLAVESAVKLRDLDPKVLTVGHGNPVRGPVPAMTAAIEKRS